MLKSCLLLSIFTMSTTSLRVKLGIFSIANSRVPEIKKNIKLPVWPVWGGVLAQLAEWSGNTKLCESILNTVGGRVVPMTLESSPFLLLAHHCHSFTPFDPIRALTTFVLPEGFPAHPHSGFDTVTYCLEGGLVHRDSEGLKMAYGDGDVQWMRAGRGLIHEEMWNVKKSPNSHQRIEIFQLWVNLPRASKFDNPKSSLLKSNDIPIWRGTNGEIIRVVAGTLSIQETELTGPGSSLAATPVSILHVTLPAQSNIILAVPSSGSLLIYVRRGSLDCGDAGEAQLGDSVTYLPLRSVSPTASEQTSTCSIQAGSSGLDALVLIGETINEPVMWRGPLVHANENDFRTSAECFNSIGTSAYWDHGTSDSAWTEHVKRLRLQETVTKFLSIGMNKEGDWENGETDSD